MGRADPTMPKLPSFSSIPSDPAHRKSLWENVVVSTPVVLTVLATVLVGLSSSEMSSSQYFRALAAQMQSKVSDQWSFYQAKRFRDAESQNTLQILQSLNQMPTGNSHALQDAANQLISRINQPASSASLHSLLDRLNHAAAQPAQAVVLRYAGDITGPLDIGPSADDLKLPLADPSIAEVVRAVASGAPDQTTEEMAGRIPPDRLDAAITLATKNSADFDAAAQPVTRAADQLQQIVREITLSAAALPTAAEPLRRLNAIWLATRLRFDAARYEAEARGNQVLAQLYEVRVRKAGFTSDRHRRRSKEFFYGMLGAQAGVTIATLSLAVQRKSLLWGVAAASGLAAVSFAAYVYLMV
jgi:Domain of unknown function (DUF4337)